MSEVLWRDIVNMGVQTAKAEVMFAVLDNKHFAHFFALQTFSIRDIIFFQSFSLLKSRNCLIKSLSVDNALDIAQKELIVTIGTLESILRDHSRVSYLVDVI